MTVSPYIPTEMDAVLAASDFDDEAHRQRLSLALRDGSIGIKSIRSVAGWKYSKLTGPEFDKWMEQLAHDVKAVDKDALPDSEAEIKFTTAVRAALKGESHEQDRALSTMGMKANTNTHIVLGEGGDPVPTKEEIEALISLDTLFGGFALPDSFHPSMKLITFYLKGVKCSPPRIRGFKLSMACNDFHAQRNSKSKSALETMSGREDEYDAIDPFPLNSKLRVIHQIKLVMHALAIACSFTISATQAAKFTGSFALNRVEYKGATTLVYGTRYMVEAVMVYIHKYAENLTTDGLADAFQSTMERVSGYAKSGYLMNCAVKEALKDSLNDWQGLTAAVTPTKRGNEGTFETPGQGNGKRQSLKDKGICANFNKKAGCRFAEGGKVCRNGKHVCSQCGSKDHGHYWHTSKGGTSNQNANGGDGTERTKGDEREARIAALVKK